MQKEITVRDKKIFYTFRKSARARNVRLAVHRDGSVVLTAPVRLPERIAESFIYKKSAWLISKIRFFSELPVLFPSVFDSAVFLHRGRRDYLKYKDRALVLVMQKLETLNAEFGYHHYYNRVSIKNQKTCWGSCSRKGNLNFNYKILFLPERMQDYVIVHELCHLKELNHSQEFWALVAHAIPEYALLRKALRQRVALR